MDVGDSLLVYYKSALRAAQVEVESAVRPNVEPDNNQLPTFTGCERGILRRRGTRGGCNFAEGSETGRVSYSRCIVVTLLPSVTETPRSSP